MVGRAALLVVAFVVAGLGAVLVYLYASQADERAVAALDPVEVVVVSQLVEAGTSVAAAQAAGAFETRARPRSAVPADALTTLEGRVSDVVLATLYPGEVLLPGRLGDPADQDRLAIPDGMLASTFTFADPNRVAGFVEPGRSVAVFLTTQSTQPGVEDPLTGGSGGRGGPSTRLLLGDVQVIAIGGTTIQTVTTTDDQGQQQTVEEPSSLLTLALSQADAQKLILGQSLGELYLGLLDETSRVTQDGGVTPDDLFEVTTP